MKRALSILATAPTFFIVVAIAIHAQKPLRITGTYSNMYFNEEGGDVSGEELKIVLACKGYQGALQFAQGVPSDLVVVDVKVDGTKVTFSIPERSEYPGRFRGIVENGVLKGKFSFANGASEEVKLKRGKSYWD